MSRFRKLTHTIYECKYHIVICPKYRYRIFEGEVAEYTRQKLYQLCREKDLVEILEMNIQKDHIHLVVSIASKYSISSIMGFLKGKISIKLFQRYEKVGKRYWGRHLWSRGYCVSTVGLDEEKIRKYVKWQEKNDRTNEQLEL
jgi:putative transposase